MIKDLQEGQVISGMPCCVGSGTKFVENGSDTRIFGVIGDNTGSIGISPIWKSTEVQRELFKEGNFIAVSGKITTYNDVLQLVIESAKQLNENDVDLNDFFPSLEKEEIDKNASILYSKLNEIEGPFGEFVRAAYLKNRIGLLPEKYKNNYEAICHYRGALKFHHDKLGGLAKHLIECDDIILNNAPYLISQGVPFDINIARAASFITDIKKLEDYICSPENNSVVRGLEAAGTEEDIRMLNALEYSCGNNHEITGRDIVSEVYAKYGILTYLQAEYLKAVITFHHGGIGVINLSLNEKIPEGWLVHFADFMSTMMNKTIKAFSK